MSGQEHYYRFPIYRLQQVRWRGVAKSSFVTDDLSQPQIVASLAKFAAKKARRPAVASPRERRRRANASTTGSDERGSRALHFLRPCGRRQLAPWPQFHCPPQPARNRQLVLLASALDNGVRTRQSLKSIAVALESGIPVRISASRSLRFKLNISIPFAFGILIPS